MEHSLKDGMKNIIKEGIDLLKGSPEVKAAGLTDRGLKREINEDNFYINNKEGIFIVSDGVGGARAGEKASEMVVHLLPVQITSAYQAHHSEFAIEKAIEDLSDQMRDYMNGRDELRGGGATVVACLIRSGTAFVGHIGDSRAYLIRGTSFEQLTEDHSVISYLIKSGIITKEEAKTHPARHQITRCMGMKEHAHADVKRIELKKGDMVLLCTDGLTEMLSDDDIKKVLLEETDINSACKKLIDIANFVGGRDNITAVIIEYGIDKKKLTGEKENIFVNLFKG